MRSIRVFLTLSLISVAVLLNFAAALRGYHRGMVQAEELFNQRMHQNFDLLNYSLPELSSRADTRPGARRLLARTLAPGSSIEFQWLRPDGEVLAHSEGMPATRVAPLEAGFRFVNFAGHRWHVLTGPSADGQSWFTLAERDDQRWRMAESIILPAVYPMLLAVPLLGATIWLLLGIGLKPVSTLARDLEQREASDLRALPAEGLPSELRPLALSANALLARLEASFARERRFSADAAHELRTPLAALRIQCENLAHAGGVPAASVAKLQAGVERLGHLVEQILILNRIAPDQFMGRFEPIALGTALRRLIAEESAALESKAIEIELLGDEAQVQGDRFALESMLRNLLDNAIKYTPTGGTIRVRIAGTQEGTVLDIIDSGVGIAAELRARVFDRFYRVDGDRNDSGQTGSGLGLSIVRHVADLHGARIELKDSEFAQGLWVRLVFPRPEERPKHAAV